jgi:nicotinate-nucleotide adenylyltransferase
VRLGIFGGSFDPPHIGHFLAAVDATEALALDRLFWVPAARQPFKTDVSDGSSSHEASPDDRFAMVAAATLAHPKFVPSRIEIDRVGLSYTVTTVEHFAQEYPNAELFLLMGADAWSQFGSWYQPERIRTFVRVAVFARTFDKQGGASGATLVPDHLLPSRLVDVSSTEVRARVRAGKPIRGFVPDAVAEIIESKGLYRW